MELKNTFAELKYSLETPNSRMVQAEESVSSKTNYSKLYSQRSKRIERKKYHLQNVENYLKRENLKITGVQVGVEQEQE